MSGCFADAVKGMDTRAILEKVDLSKKYLRVIVGGVKVKNIDLYYTH